MKDLLITNSVISNSFELCKYLKRNSRGQNKQQILNNNVIISEIWKLINFFNLFAIIQHLFTWTSKQKIM